MTVLETIAVAFSMYSAIPVPQFKWTERNMRYALCAFPLIGLITGLLCWAVWALMHALGIPSVFCAALMCAVPVIITGGIHLDGYADTCDALASHADREKKLEILSDPHIGSFAVIRICCHFVIMFAAWAALKEFDPLPFIVSFCLSRTLSALAVCAFPKAKKKGLAYTFSQAVQQKKITRILTVMDIALSAVMCITGLIGLFMALAAHAVFVYYYFMSKRVFGGITGDLAGWFLVQAEKWMLAAAVVFGFILS